MSNITKLTNLKPIEPINVSGAKTLKIESSNEGAWPFGWLFLVNVRLE